MSLPTPSQSVSHKQFLQCVNHKKKLTLRHPSPTFGSFSFSQASIWLRVNKVLQKLQEFDINDLRLLFHCNILIPRKCSRKTPFKAQCPKSYSLIVCNCFDYLWNFVTCSFSNELHIAWKYYCTSVQTTICPLHWIDQRLNTKTAASFDRIKNQNVQNNHFFS